MNMDIYTILLNSKNLDPTMLDTKNSILVDGIEIPVVAYAFFSREELEKSVDFANMVGNEGELFLYPDKSECVVCYKYDSDPEDVFLMLYLFTEKSKENYLLKKMTILATKSAESQFSLSEEFLSTNASNEILYLINGIKQPIPQFTTTIQ